MKHKARYIATLAISALFSATLCSADAIDLAIDKGFDDEAINYLQSQLTDYDLRPVDVTFALLPKAEWLIVVGEENIAWAIEHRTHYKSIIFSQIREETWRRLNNTDGLYALFLDQPVERQKALIEVVLPQSLKIGLVEARVGDSVDAPSDLSRIDIAEGPGWQQALSRKMLAFDALLLKDHALIYQPEKAHALLLTAYRQGKPVFGPGKIFVEAGAVASCYTTNSQYFDQVIYIINTLSMGGSIPATLYPSHFQVISNRPVMRSLGFDSPDDIELARLVRRALEKSQ